MYFTPQRSAQSVAARQGSRGWPRQGWLGSGDSFTLYFCSFEDQDALALSLINGAGAAELGLQLFRVYTGAAAWIGDYAEGGFGV